MGPVVGIDLGTTNSLVAHLQGGGAARRRRRPIDDIDHVFTGPFRTISAERTSRETKPEVTNEVLVYAAAPE